MFNKVLIPLDGSALAEGVLPHALTISRTFEAEVIFAHVLEPFVAPTEGRIDPLTWQMLKVEGQSYMQNMSNRWSEVAPPAETVLLEGAAAKCIISYAGEHGCDLLVLSSHGRSGLSEWNVSSVVQKVIMRAFRSVMIVRAATVGPQEILHPKNYERILVPLDGSRRSEGVLPIFQRLAQSSGAESSGAEVILVHIVQSPIPFRQLPSPRDVSLAEEHVRRNVREATDYLEQLCSRWVSSPARYQVIVSESPSMALLELAEESKADLVLFSAHGRTAAHHPYGSTVTKFITYGSMPVLIYQDLSEAQLHFVSAEAMADSTHIPRGPLALETPV